jgi:hypothetical protein
LDHKMPMAKVRPLIAIEALCSNVREVVGDDSSYFLHVRLQRKKWIKGYESFFPLLLLNVSNFISK